MRGEPSRLALRRMRRFVGLVQTRDLPNRELPEKKK